MRTESQELFSLYNHMIDQVGDLVTDGDFVSARNLSSKADRAYNKAWWTEREEKGLV